MKKQLLCVTGLSPQVVTETLYALAMQATPWVPETIHIITTKEGAQRIKLMLLHPQTGWLNALRQEYQLPPIQLDDNTIHILQNSQGKQLEDIRTREDNETLADFITDIVRKLTRDNHSQLHVSIAGGRKTMGFYAGYAMSLFGREQDRLSHVLVSEPFESNRDFFYPSRQSRVIYTFDDNNRPLDTSKAEVSLAEIPFVRMRYLIPDNIIQDKNRFIDVVKQTQQAVGNRHVKISLPDNSLYINGERIKLQPQEFTLYLWLAERAKAQQPGIHWSQNASAPEYMRYYSKIMSTFSAHYERTEKKLQHGMDKDFFELNKAKVNQKIKQQLGKLKATPYLIQSIGKIPQTRYKLFGISLEPANIKIIS